MRPTAERVRELLDYDTSSGIFRWSVAPSRKVRPGDIAGSEDPGGYLIIGIGGRKYRAHRLAWFYVHGEWPPSDIDHIDNHRCHNWIANLRPATKTQNMANSLLRANNKARLKGVHYHPKARKWQAQIKCEGEFFYLGLFLTPEDAHAAYVAAAEKLFGEFARAA